MKKAFLISLFLICASLSGFAQTSIQGRETDVRAWGAKCDGVTNDTSAIQAAITAMATAGGIVNLPDGTCIVTGLSVPGGVTLRGKGKYTTTIKSSTNATIIAAVQGSGAFADKGPKITDLAIDGSDSGSSQVGLLITDAVVVRDVTIEDVYISDCGSHGVSFGNVFSSSFKNIYSSSNVGYNFFYNSPNMPSNYFYGLYSGDVNAATPAGYRIKQGNFTCWSCNGVNVVPATAYWAVLGGASGDIDGDVSAFYATAKFTDCNIEGAPTAGVLVYPGSVPTFDGLTTFVGLSASSGSWVAVQYDTDASLTPENAKRGYIADTVIFSNSPASFYANSQPIRSDGLPPLSVNGRGPQIAGGGAAGLINTYYNTATSRAERLPRVDGFAPTIDITTSTSFTNPGGRAYRVNCASPCTLTLPSPNFYENGNEIITVFNLSATGTNVTIAANGGASVNGSSYVLSVQGASVQLFPDFTSLDWRVVATRQDTGTSPRIPYYADANRLTTASGLEYDSSGAAVKTPGRFWAADTSASNPSFAFTSDTDTGFYRPSANTIGIAANGANVGSFGATGLTLGVPGSVAGALILANSTNSNATTLQSGAPASSISITLPATLPASAGCLQISSTGVITQTGSACGAGGGSVTWDAITNPAANQALSMGAFTTAWTWNNATSTANLFQLADSASNTGTGYVLSLNTASGSAAKPIRITAGGTAVGVEMTTAGVLQAINSGEIRATMANPSATVGLTATNGSSTSAMRADAAPALSQSIAPTWTASHTFAATMTAREIDPQTDNTYDLGTTSLRWKTLHVGPGSVVVHNDATNTLKATLGFSGSTAQVTTDAATPLQLRTGSNNGLFLNTNGTIGFNLTSATSGNVDFRQLANGDTIINMRRATDTSPTGNFQTFQNAAGTSLWTVDITGSLTAGTIPAARVSSGTIAAANGGTGIDTSGSTGVLRVSSGTWSANAGISHLAASTSADLRGVITDETGTGAAVFAGGNIGAATATSLNGLTITSSTGTLTITNGKTASFSNSITFAGTDSTTMTFPATSDTVAGVGTANSWGDGIKQTFNPNGTNAGINVGSVAGDPSTPVNGDLWYDSTANELTARINGANVALGSGGGGGITSLNGLTGATQTFAVGTSGTDFAISSSGTTHTFNLPDAGASNRGAVTTGTQTLAGAKTFTSLGTFNPSTTPLTNALLIDINALGTAGTRDSNTLAWRGRSFDTSAKAIEWRSYVDVTSNAGGSQLTFGSRIDAAAFTDVFTLTDAGDVSAGLFSGTSFTTSGGSILDDDVNAATGFTVAGAAATGQYLRGNGTRAVFSAIQSSDLPSTVVRTDQANTYTTGAQSFSSAASLTVPVSAGAGPSANGTIAYDSTANALEYGGNGVNRTVANLDEAQTFTNKTISGSVNTLANIGNASLTNSSITVSGTANQVTVSGGSPVSLGGTVTLSTPQNIHTGATPQFAGMGLGETAPTAGLGITGQTLTTQATGTAGGLDVTSTVSKNDSNTRSFSSALIHATINTGGSNTSTTFNVLEVDATQTATTGTVVNLLNLKSGGSSVLTVSTGGFVSASVGYQANGVSVPTISSADTLTNKTMSGSSNTFSNIAATSLAGLNSLTTATPATDDSIPIYDTSASANRRATITEVVGTVTEGYINGAMLTYSSTTQVQITTGTVHIQSSASLMRITSTLTVSPSLSPNTWYHCYVFSNAGTPSAECVTTAPASPYVGTARSKTSDTTRRYVGSIRTDGSSQIRKFIMSGGGSFRTILWMLDTTASPFRVLSGGLATVNTNVDLSAVVPNVSSLIKVARIRLVNLSSAAVYVFVDNSDMSGTNPASASGFTGIGQNADVAISMPINSSQIIRYAYSGGTPSGSGAFIEVQGYEVEL